jgi:hypothetical protein
MSFFDWLEDDDQKTIFLIIKWYSQKRLKILSMQSSIHLVRVDQTSDEKMKKWTVDSFKWVSYISQWKTFFGQIVIGESTL